jgi:hypothetical protein
VIICSLGVDYPSSGATKAILARSSARGDCSLLSIALWFFEIAFVLLRLDHAASVIVNANHGHHVTGCNPARVWAALSKMMR